MSDEIVDEYMKEKGVMQTRICKDYAETRLFQHGKYSIWQCQLQGRGKYYELRKDVKLWEMLLLKDGVISFSLNFADVEHKLKQILTFPEPVDEDIIEKCNKLKEMLK